MALHKIELGACGISEAITVNDALGYFECASWGKFDGESGLERAHTYAFIFFNVPSIGVVHSQFKSTRTNGLLSAVICSLPQTSSSFIAVPHITEEIPSRTWRTRRTRRNLTAKRIKKGENKRLLYVKQSRVASPGNYSRVFSCTTEYLSPAMN